MRRLVAALGLLATLLACTPASPGSGPGQLRVVLADDWAPTAAVQQAVKAFEARHGGVRVEVDGVPFSQVPAVVAEAEEAGAPYDLAQWHAFAAGAKGQARPLDEQWRAAGLSAGDYLPGAVDDVTWGGRRYGVPLDVNALVLLASEPLLAEAGVEPSELATIDGFREAASRLAASSARHALAMTASGWAAYGWIVASGGGLLATDPDGVALLDADGDPTFTFDDERTVAALRLLAGLVQRGEAPMPLGPDAGVEALAAFTGGETALHASGSWDLPAVRRDVRAELGVQDVLVLPMPQADPDAPRTVLGGSSLYVPVGSTEPDAAFELALALTEMEVGLQLVEQEGRLPALAAAYDAPVFDDSGDLAAFVAQLERAEVMPLIAFPEVSGEFHAALEDVLAGRVDAGPAMDDVQRFAESWLDRR